MNCAMSSMYSKAYDDVLGKLLASNAVSDAVFIIRDGLKLGHVTYHLAFNVGAPLDNPYVRTTYPPDWVSHYLLNNYVATDPVVIHGVTAKLPFFWDEVPPTSAAEAIFADAQKFGVASMGFSVPHVDGKGRKSLFSVTADPEAEDWRRDIEDKAEVLSLLAHDIHIKALSEFYASESEVPQLAPRELECLRWCADGKTYAEIAIILGLSEHTVRSYLKSVRLRLDCVSLAQAVSKASKLKII